MLFFLYQLESWFSLEEAIIFLMHEYEISMNIDAVMSLLDMI